MVFSPLAEYVTRSQSEPTERLEYEPAIRKCGKDVWTASYPTVESYSPVWRKAIREQVKAIQSPQPTTAPAIPPEPGNYEQRLQQILLQPKLALLTGRPKVATLPLPLELRIQIYTHLFHTSYTALWQCASPRKPHVPLPSPSTNILLVSSTTHAEASQILYSQTRIFHFDILTYASVPRRIYLAKLSLPRNLTIKVDCFWDCSSPKHRRVLLLNRFLDNAAVGAQPRRLEIETNVHGFRRLGLVKHFGLFRAFEQVRIWACVNGAHLDKKRDWVGDGGSYGWVLAPEACREHMAYLLKRMRAEIGVVRVTEREVRCGGRRRGPDVRIEVVVTPGVVEA